MAKTLVLGFCPGGGGDIFPFDEVFDKGQDVSKSIEGVSAVVFWGGTDIHSSFYAEPQHKTNQQQGPLPMARDVFEKRAMLYCIANKIPIIGVCRGAQLMCAMAGGSVIQDVTGHVGNGSHSIVTYTGEIINTTSCHHQMMYPFDVEHEMLAWTSGKLSKHYKNGWDVDMKEMVGRVEPEIVYFPKIQGLAIQGHPEWMGQKSRLVQFCNEQIIDKLLNNQTLESVV